MPTVEPSDILKLLAERAQHHGDATCSAGLSLAQGGENILTVCHTVIEALSREKAAMLKAATEAALRAPPPVVIASGGASESPMARIGYARVSTLDQDLTVQLAALKAAGCDIIRSEKVSGSSTVGRDELRTVLAFIREGDTLVVTRVDRLARSIGDLQDIVRELRGKGAGLLATEQPIDTATAAGKAFLDMLGVFAEFETNLRRERQAERDRQGEGRRRLHAGAHGRS